jgi:hypothetical protein
MPQGGGVEAVLLGQYCDTQAAGTAEAVLLRHRHLQDIMLGHAAAH